MNKRSRRTRRNDVGKLDGQRFDPPCQGRGLCSRLMRALGRTADADALPCYLETSGRRNAGIYERYGYRVVGTYTLEVEDDEEGSRPFTEFFAMLRDPEEA